MSTEQPGPQVPKLTGYLAAWGNSVGHVLQQVADAPHHWQELAPDAAETLFASLKENCIGVQFEATEHLSGNQGFVLSNKDAVRLAQLLLAEPPDGGCVLSDDHRDAIGELFRQFAGAAASALKELAGGPVGFKWIGLAPFAGQPAVRRVIEWTSPGLSPIDLVFDIGAPLFAALSPVVPPVAEEPTPVSAAASVMPPRDPKLELLMDVELDVTLRFGEREMALRDILDLSAGSVVELNQGVQEPVALLVGKKMVARGEVVVVNGNYALRVLEIISPADRIESLRS